MPNTHSTLTELFTDIADSIRSKAGTSAPIVADAFPAAIDAIPSGGGGDALRSIIERTASAIADPSVSFIASSVFFYYAGLLSVSFPACKDIFTQAFRSCSSLKTANFPACTTIDSMAFAQCSSLKTANFPACTTISSTAFQGAGLEMASFPACTTIGSSAFYQCFSIKTAAFPTCSEINAMAFFMCSSLDTVSFPALKKIDANVFAQCNSLKTASFPACTTIGSSAFNKCTTLLSLYLLGSSVPVLVKSNAFSSTPIGGYTDSTEGVYGSIIVKESMLDAFKTATNWSIFSSRFSVWNGID